jgi:O-antigen/teichoic acid export membrane protein
MSGTGWAVIGFMVGLAAVEFAVIMRDWFPQRRRHEARKMGKRWWEEGSKRRT